MNKQEAETQYRQADSWFRDGQYAQALASLETLGAQFPNMKNIMCAQARCLHALGHRQEAEDLCSRIVGLFDTPDVRKLMLEIKASNEPVMNAEHANRLRSLQAFAAQAAAGRAFTTVAFADLGLLLDAVCEAIRRVAPTETITGDELENAYKFNCPTCGTLRTTSVLMAAMAMGMKGMNPSLLVNARGPNVPSYLDGKCSGCSGTVVHVRFDAHAIGALANILASPAKTAPVSQESLSHILTLVKRLEVDLRAREQLNEVYRSFATPVQKLVLSSKRWIGLIVFLGLIVCWRVDWRVGLVGAAIAYAYSVWLRSYLIKRHKIHARECIRELEDEYQLSQEQSYKLVQSPCSLWTPSELAWDKLSIRTVWPEAAPKWNVSDPFWGKNDVPDIGCFKELASVLSLCGNTEHALGAAVGIFPQLAKAADVHGYTLLHYAVKENDLGLAKALIRLGADVAAKTAWGKEKGFTSLDIALSTAGLGMVKTLVDCGSPLLPPEKILTPLLRGDISEEERLAIVQILQRQGMDIMWKDVYGGNLLHELAIWQGDNNRAVSAAKFLIDGGVDVNARAGGGQTPLHCCVRPSTRAELVEYLISRGADPLARDDEGLTPDERFLSHHLQMLRASKGL